MCTRLTRKARRGSCLDIVLPLLEVDLLRYLRLQRPTFERLYADLRRTWIITRPSDLVRIRRATSRLPGVTVVDERELVPEASARARMMLLIPWQRGWHIQQLIKLAAVARSDTEFALVLDADVVAVRPVTDADLIVGDRALRPKEPFDTHPGWVAQAAAVLGMEPTDYSASVTPSILSRDAVQLLAEYAARFVRPRGRARVAAVTPGLSRLLKSWRGRLISALPWTEFQLYDTFLVGTGNFQRFHWSSGMDPPRLYGPCVWHADQFANWFPDPTVGVGTHFFAVVQGNLGIPVEAVEERLREGGVLGKHTP